MAERSQVVAPGDLLAYEEWTPERGKVLLVLTTTRQMTTCLRSDGATVVERAAAIRTATRVVASARARA